MHGSAFDSIDDPNDPAWHGHAVVASRFGAPHRVAVGATLVLLAAGIVAVWTWSGRADASPSDRAQASAVTGATRPARDPGASIEVTSSDAPGGVEQWLAQGSATRAAAPASAGSATKGSGWAPAAATIPEYAKGSGLLKGDLAGIDPRLIRKLDAVAVALDRRIEVLSGWRTHHEQGELYQRFLAGTGNLAAVPGTSEHEAGRAADVYVDGVALASVPDARELAASVGLHFPVQGEAWHVEMVGGAAAR